MKLPNCYQLVVFMVATNVSAMSSGGLRGRIYQTTHSLRAGQVARITYITALLAVVNFYV